MGRIIYGSGRAPRMPRVTGGDGAPPDREWSITQVAARLRELAATDKQFLMFWRIGEQGSTPLDGVSLRELAALKSMGLVVDNGATVGLTKGGRVVWVGLRGMME